MSESITLPCKTVHKEEIRPVCGVVDLSDKLQPEMIDVEEPGESEVERKVVEIPLEIPVGI